MINSRNHLVSATALSSRSKSHHQKRRTFSRSYGTNLPSSFTRVLSSALVFSTCLPVSVCGTANTSLCLEAFLGSRASTPSCLSRDTPRHISALFPRICLRKLPTCLDSLFHTGCTLSFLRHSIATRTSTGILTCYPSTTPLGLALGADSPCSD